MALFKKKPKTSAEKAQKAQMGIFARLIGCAYLIYIVIQLLKTSPEDETLNPTLKIVISVFFLIAAAAVIVITVLEFTRNWKSGSYKSAAYTDDIIENYASHDDEEEASGSPPEKDASELTETSAETEDSEKPVE